MPAGKGAPRGPHGLPNRVQCTLEGPRESPVVSHEMEVFDLETFEKNLKIKILECKPQIVVLELKGCDASLANALRRILIIYARDLKWIPMSERQKQKFAQDPPAPVHPDILITKLRPGQEIELFGFLEKGLGKTHAKWSPVATAVYRLEPEFVFTSPIEGEDAEELKELCPMGVFDIEDSTGRAYAKFPRNCTTCRACLERFENQLQLNKIPDQFIFSIESTGSVPAPELFEMAVEVLLEKAITFREIIRTKQLE
ncbi:DNA-directed RNA polymerases I and III subunit RPAC1, putative [Eimeria necatrix]|uniref:DNA-directed RNA polymerases I and III subunit RPAC1, putative n=1 Tax=Eimeria necatrix TaxID=51315 RepID=U6N1J6_9EIME|nr:DNA-directed RNA polymerases I and III subunit RPAC1, putative [Eimeria necatrix]CDJ69178.1 DNA-directed RNA polymerases I and III subunit RPAC1, putative [Eimeria necatrix]